MGFWIYRSGQQFGPYSRENLQQYLADGRILPMDLGWTDGSTQWVPLSQLLAITSVPASPLPLQPSLPRPFAAGPITAGAKEGMQSIVFGAIIIAVGLAVGFVLGTVLVWNQRHSNTRNPDVTDMTVAGVLTLFSCVLGFFATKGKNDIPFWYMFIGGVLPSFIFGAGWSRIHQGLKQRGASG
jgi:hypothetical protein